MSAEIVNLRRARKARARREAEAEAAENRVRFGRSKAERERLRRQGELDDKRIEGARRDGSAETPDAATETAPEDEPS